MCPMKNAMNSECVERYPILARHYATGVIRITDDGRTVEGTASDGVIVSLGSDGWENVEAYLRDYPEPSDW